jgi:cytochrome oxidase Cu insertion factor (SCO1/SenC/PrrC family)
MSRWWLIVLAGLLAGTAFAAAPALTTYPAPGPAPPFSLDDMHGDTHTLADYPGKVIISAHPEDCVRLCLLG